MILLLATPAEACHKFSRWHYPWPQRCEVFHVKQKGGVAFARTERPKYPRIEKAPGAVASVTGGALPSLEVIDWGASGDDRLRGIALLRDLNDSPRP